MRNKFLGRETHWVMDEDNDLLARLNVLIVNALREQVEEMIENRQLCGDTAVDLGEEESVNTEDEDHVDEGGDAGSEGWRTPPEDLVGVCI